MCLIKWSLQQIIINTVYIGTKLWNGILSYVLISFSGICLFCFCWSQHIKGDIFKTKNIFGWNIRWLEKSPDSFSGCSECEKYSWWIADAPKKWLKWDSDGIRLYLGRPQNGFSSDSYTKLPQEMSSLSLLDEITLAVLCTLSITLDYSEVRDLTRLDLDCITLHNDAFSLGENSGKGQVNSVMFSGPPVTKKRHPEIPASQRSPCGFDTWPHTARHSRQRDRRAVFVTCWRRCPRGCLDTTSLFARQQRSCALYSHYSCLELSQRAWEHSLTLTVCLCELVVCNKSNLFMFSVVRIEVCLVSKFSF